MSPEATLILNIIHTTVNSLFTFGLTSFGVFTFESEDSMGPSLIEFVTKHLTELLGDKFIGLVDSAEISTKKAGDYFIVLSGTEVALYHVEEKIVSGWITNGKENFAVVLGTFKFVTNPARDEATPNWIDVIKTALQVSESKIAELKNALDVLSVEKAKSDAEAEKLRGHLYSRSDEIRKLLTELDRMRKNADRDIEKIVELSNEVSDLRRKASEGNVLRETAPVRTRISETPVVPAYDDAIAEIKNFNKSMLRTREERDELLKKKAAPAGDVARADSAWNQVLTSHQLDYPYEFDSNNIPVWGRCMNIKWPNMRYVA